VVANLTHDDVEPGVYTVSPTFSSVKTVLGMFFGMVRVVVLRILKEQRKRGK